MRSFATAFLRSFRPVFLAPLLGLTAFAASPAVTKADPLASKSAGAEEEVIRANPGPWGKIEYNSVFLEAPDHLLATVPVPNSTPRWFFPAATIDSVRALLERAGLPAEVQSGLLDKKRALVEASSVTLFPIAADFEAMTPAKTRFSSPGAGSRNGCTMRSCARNSRR
jgi:hypothetical protein